MQMKSFFLAFAAILAAGAESPKLEHNLALSATPANQSDFCWQAPEIGGVLAELIKSYVGPSGATADGVRAALGLLQASPDSVYIVTADSLCRRASVARGLFQITPDTTNLRPVLLLKAGPLRYVIDDGVTRAGEWSITFVADTSFSIVGAITH